MYKVENQPKVEVQSSKKGKMNESNQHVKHLRHEQIYSNRGGGGVHGSGMRAIFLGGLGSRNVVSGTGVFLPRSPSDATDHTRKKPGITAALNFLITTCSRVILNVLKLNLYSQKK